MSVLEPEDAIEIDEAIRQRITNLAKGQYVVCPRTHNYVFDLTFKSDLNLLAAEPLRLVDFVQPLCEALVGYDGSGLDAATQLVFNFTCVDDPMVLVRLTVSSWTPSFPFDSPSYWKINGFTRHYAVTHRFPMIAFMKVKDDDTHTSR